VKRVESYFTEIKSMGKIPEPALLQKEIKKMVKSDVPSFFNLLLRFIEENSNTWSLSSYKKMKTFYSQLKNFSLERKEPVLPGTINQSFSEELVKYYRQKGLADSSIKKNLDLLKWFMNWCLKRNLIFNRDYEHIRFSPGKSISTHEDIYMKWEEISRFYCIDGLSRKEEWSRDLFCFIAFTGIRFSKLGLLKRVFVSGGYIFTNQEQGQKIILNRFSGEICKKYENRYYRNNTLFPAMSLITFHKHLKSAASKAGLNRVIYNKPGDSAPDTLYKLVSARTAINTYYANVVRLDIPDGYALISRLKTSKSRIIASSGSAMFAIEKHLTTSDQLYESIRSSGSRP
jgi:integrase